MTRLMTLLLVEIWKNVMFIRRNFENVGDEDARNEFLTSPRHQIQLGIYKRLLNGWPNHAHRTGTGMSVADSCAFTRSRRQ
ncbi:hypothetical protein J6590_003060 [Homalodisca vitripennis]|nr:hypothetical protein J6590_003060 [Homalodisca vitripennis]